VVAKEIGTSPGEVVRLMFTQMVKRRAIPFRLSADSPEDEVLGPVHRRAAMWDELWSPRLGILGLWILVWRPNQDGLMSLALHPMEG